MGYNSLSRSNDCEALKQYDIGETMYAGPIFGALFVIVLVSSACYEHFREKASWPNSLGRATFFAFMATLISFTIMLFLSLALATTERRVEVVSNQDLVALVNRDGWGFSGSTFLFGGTISGKTTTVYHYMVKTELGKEPRQVENPPTRIVIDDGLAEGQQPKLEVLRHQVKRVGNKFVSLIVITNDGTWYDKDFEPEIYKFSIPRGSLVETIAVSP